MHILRLHNLITHHGYEPGDFAHERAFNDTGVKQDRAALERAAELRNARNVYKTGHAIRIDKDGQPNPLPLSPRQARKKRRFPQSRICNRNDSTIVVLDEHALRFE